MCKLFFARQATNRALNPKGSPSRENKISEPSSTSTASAASGGGQTPTQVRLSPLLLCSIPSLPLSPPLSRIYFWLLAA
jgi:hypothetical protein